MGRGRRAGVYIGEEQRTLAVPKVALAMFSKFWDAKDTVISHGAYGRTMRTARYYANEERTVDVEPTNAPMVSIRWMTS